MLRAFVDEDRAFQTWRRWFDGDATAVRPEHTNMTPVESRNV